MKKILVLFIICSMGMSLLAQNAEPADSKIPLTKRGYKILPEEGDFAIGIDATPFLQYLGNLFNKDANKAPFVDGYKGAIYGKYFLTDNMAIRARLSLDISSLNYKGVVPDNAAIYLNPMNSDATTVDVQTINHQAFGLAAGWEYRRGYRRLQGFGGGEIGAGFGNTTSRYEYGNPMTELNQNPTSTDFDGNVFTNGRVTEIKHGTTWNAFVAGFIGVEYFIAPKLSIGGEFGLGCILNGTSQGTRATEQWDGSQVFEQTTRYYNSDEVNSGVKVGTLTKGTIFLMFHF